MSESKAASEAYLGALHKKTAKRLTEELEKTDGDVRYIGYAIKFLSDNKVTMVKEIGNELDELSKRLKNKKKRLFKEPENVVDISTELAKEIAAEG